MPVTTSERMTDLDTVMWSLDQHPKLSNTIIGVGLLEPALDVERVRRRDGVGHEDATGPAQVQPMRAAHRDDRVRVAGEFWRIGEHIPIRPQILTTVNVEARDDVLRLVDHETS